ncbi:MAG: L-seryl-tRNA(Sec) selenium transferase [Chloroflexi bacterium]|nr:L-seryl-tRNA(Sec) selenium transferase [Chloroflexota bacterium]
MNDKEARLRRLPSVDSLLGQTPIQELIDSHSRELVIDSIRQTIDSARQAIVDSRPVETDLRALLSRVEQHLRESTRPSLRPVINATGVIIHTNLGRAVLSVAAREAMLAAASSYNNLEFDLGTGKRGSRLSHAGQLLRALTGAEDAVVVNNNASALVLILSALAQDREVVISRGQLVEIGGGFRIPDIMRESGAHLVEVGTTNRTRTADFAAALSERAAMLLRVHASNFKQVGFVEQPPLSELAALARERGLLAVDDLGSGTLLDTASFGLEREPTIQESVAAGVDLVCFSGDKLLGGPQAGIIVGRSGAIEALKRHPLARALRVDKLTYAALIATLQHYRRGEALKCIPVWQMISRPLDDIRARASFWAEAVGGVIIEGESTVGGGSLPGATLPTALLAVDCDAPDLITARLRQAETPVIARIADGRVLLDPRTVLPAQDEALLQALQDAI